MQATQSLFTYGSLRDRDVLELVLDRRVDPECYCPATLTGYRVARVPDESYPVLITAPGEKVHGDVIAGLDERDMARIRFFESEEYEFEEAVVDVQAAGAAPVLLCGAGVMEPGATEDWDLAHWQADAKAEFLRKVSRFMALFGNAGVEEAERLWAEMEKTPPAG